MHPSIVEILAFFDYSHLPPFLADASRPFCELAHTIAVVPGAETTVALRKLLESKDCHVRAVLAAKKKAEG